MRASARLSGPGRILDKGTIAELRKLPATQSESGTKRRTATNDRVPPPAALSRAGARNHPTVGSRSFPRAR